MKDFEWLYIATNLNHFMVSMYGRNATEEEVDEIIDMIMNRQFPKEV